MENDRIELELDALRDAQGLLKEARSRAKTVRDRVDIDFAFQQIGRASVVIRNLQTALRKSEASKSSPPVLGGRQSALTEGGE